MTALGGEARSSRSACPGVALLTLGEESLDDSRRRPRTISKRGTSTTSMPTPTVPLFDVTVLRGSAAVDVSTKTARHA